MRRRRMFYVGLIMFGLLVFPLGALAGGWAVVTLDSLPEEPRAGQTLSLGFMVRQHGKEPIDRAFGTELMIPRLMATNTDTGTTLNINSRKEGPLGHFVVDVTFPEAGNWEWQIQPGPFMATKLGTLTILPAVATATQSASVAQPAPAVSAVPMMLRWAGVVLVLAAAVLMLTNRRNLSGMRRPSAT